MPVLLPKEKQNSKIIGEYYTTLKKNNLISIEHKKYFLMCKSCFWMASTLSCLKSLNNLWPIYRQCPTCENKIDKFAIPSDLN
jgi:hypothetical protein